MPEIRQKIPVLLKLKRLKNSDLADRINSIVSSLKPNKKYKNKPGKILLMRNDKIGDAVVTLPVIRDIKLNYPEIIIDVLVSSGNKFVFDDFEYADEIIEFNWAFKEPGKIYTLPVLGGFLQFIRYTFIPYLFSSSYRRQISYLRLKKYDVSADLTGLLRNALLGKLISAFTIGPRKFLTHIIYNYYIDSNWVSDKDTDFMTAKIEKAISNALNLDIKKKNTSVPVLVIKEHEQTGETHDIIFHTGSPPLRKMDSEKEEKLIKLISSKRVLITGEQDLERWNVLKMKFAGYNNVIFKLFNTLTDAAKVCLNSKLLICYDGGQAHYLAQFIKTAVIFGPGSAELWRPYEFSGYTMLEENEHGIKAFKSGGKFGHIAIYKDIWCNPCFDVGCKEKPCLNNIEPEFIWEIIKKLV